MATRMVMPESVRRELTVWYDTAPQEETCFFRGQSSGGPSGS